MEISATPSGQIIIRIEADEVLSLRAAFVNSAMACHVFAENGKPMLDSSVTAEKTAEWMEQIGDGLEKAQR